MKAAMRSMRPKLLKFIESLPESDRAPYMSLLSRFDEGMNVNWSHYHKLHSVPKYLFGGRVPDSSSGYALTGPMINHDVGKPRAGGVGFNRGGGIVRPGRYSYGKSNRGVRSGNPKVRADQIKARDEAKLAREQSRQNLLTDTESKSVPKPSPHYSTFDPTGETRTVPRSIPLLGTKLYHEMLAVGNPFASRGIEKFAPMSVNEVAYQGFSKKGGSVLGNAVVPSWNPGSLEMVNALKVGNMFPRGMSALDKIAEKLEKPLNALKHAILYQTKVMVQPPKLSGSKELVHVPRKPEPVLAGAIRAKTASELAADRFNMAARQLAIRNMMGPGGTPYGVADAMQHSRAMNLIADFRDNGAFAGSSWGRMSLLGRATGRRNLYTEAVRQAGRIASNWKVVDADRGIYERKGPGMLGLRRREYAQVLEDGTTKSLTRGEAHELGYRKNFQMGMGTQMGLMMGSQVGGMALMQQDPSKKILGMNPQMAGMALMGVGGTLPFLAPGMMKGINNLMAMRAASKAGTGMAEARNASLLFKFLNPAKFLAFSGALVAATAAIVVMKKMLDNWAQDARNRFGLTAKAAEQLGIEHINLAQKMKAINAANAAANASRFSGMTGVPGLMMKPEELGKLAEEAKSKYGELIETMNRADSTNFVQLMLNIKAQMLGAGKSVEETNKAILGMVAASNHADKAFKVFSNSGFTAMTDRASEQRMPKVK
jgi:hypothetical protein